MRSLHAREAQARGCARRFGDVVTREITAAGKRVAPARYTFTGERLWREDGLDLGPQPQRNAIVGQPEA